jgi:tetratricopeptide (TPR) repeat protein
VSADPPPNPAPTPTPTPIPARVSFLRAWRMPLATIALVAVGVVVWWQLTDRTRPDIPLPAEIADAEVRRAVEQTHAKVVAEPKSADAWGKYGLVLLAHLYEREADVCFTQAEKLNPADPRWPSGRALIAFKRDPENALAHLRRAIEIDKDPRYTSSARLNLAEIHLDRRELDAAVELFRRELGPLPGNPRVVFGLGLVAALQGDEPLATRQLMIVRSDPHVRKQANAQLALLARTRGDEAEARRFEAQANTLPDDVKWPDPLLEELSDLQVGRRARARMAARLEEEGRFLEAAEMYLEEAGPQRSPESLMAAGASLARANDYDRGLPLLREAATRAPNDPLIHYTLALMLFTRAEEVSLRNPESAEAKEWFREVVAEAKKVTELKSDHSRGYLFWGLALKHLGDPKGAIDPLRKGLLARPDEFELHLALGQVLAATGDKKGAEAAFEAARQLDPDDPRPAQELAKLKK